MKKHLTLLVITLFAALSMAACNNQGTSQKTGFTPAQKQQIGEICGKYIIKHPDVLVKASQELQKQQMQAMQKRAAQMVVSNAQELTHDPLSPTIGNANAKVTIIEFYDDNCHFCHLQWGIISKALKNNSSIRYVGKQFPIFAQRWKSSQYGAEMAIIAGKQGKFSAYQAAVFNAKEDLEEGKLTEADVDNIAKKIGVDTDMLKSMQNDIKAQLEKSMALAQQLGAQGTPLIIVTPTDNPSADKITVFFGYTQQDALEKAIKKAAS